VLALCGAMEPPTALEPGPSSSPPPLRDEPRDTRAANKSSLPQDEGTIAREDDDEELDDEHQGSATDDEPVVPLLLGRERRANAGSR
jgi:hypothetical protein